MTQTNNQPSILAVGSVAIDSVSTPSGKAENVLGGSVNYFSISASFFSKVAIIGVVGEDFPSNHLNWLESRGIDVSGIEAAPGKTFHWVGQYENDMNEAKTLSTALNVFETFQPKLSETHKNCPYLFLANIDPELQLNVLSQAENHRLVALDSMNFWITGKPEELKKTLKKVDILSINEGEAYLLSGQKNLIRASQIIRDMGPQVVIVKRGEYGASLFTQSGIFQMPSFLVDEVVDPTGAGDSFAGGFIGYLASRGADRQMAKFDSKKWDLLLKEAMVAGCVVASFTVEDFSIHRLSRLSESEVEIRRKALLGMTQIQY